MDEVRLAPEAHLDLQITLDRLTRVQERCREGLHALAGGKMSSTAYRTLLEKQFDAQREWEVCHHKYFVRAGFASER